MTRVRRSVVAFMLVMPAVLLVSAAVSRWRGLIYLGLCGVAFAFAFAFVFGVGAILLAPSGYLLWWWD